VTFESGSKLSRMEPSVFARCSSLSSICIPSTIRAILRPYQRIWHVDLSDGDGFDSDVRPSPDVPDDNSDF
jgi:hypothetical protein